MKTSTDFQKDTSTSFSHTEFSKKFLKFKMCTKWMNTFKFFSASNKYAIFLSWVLLWFVENLLKAMTIYSTAKNPFSLILMLSILQVPCQGAQWNCSCL